MLESLLFFKLWCKDEEEKERNKESPKLNTTKSNQPVLKKLTKYPNA